MALKKAEFNDDEVVIFDDALVYKRGEYWQLRLWLPKEHKYARFSLKTRNKSTAIDKAKLHYHELMALQLTGKSYFSITTKIGVEMYLKQRMKDVEAQLIVPGRYNTVQTHLKHWLDFVGRDVKLKELERTDCENYYYERTKTKRLIKISQSTVENEQSTINALMSWLYKNKESHIDGFDFKKLKRVDTGAEENRRNTFTDDEVKDIGNTLDAYIAQAVADIEEDGNLVKALTGYYLMISLMTGLRRGEQLQLCWKDIGEFEHKIAGQDYNLVKITVRGETSKVKKTRKFVVKDLEYFDRLFKFQHSRYATRQSKSKQSKSFSETLIFSTDGIAVITPRAIAYHFDRVMEQADIGNMSERDLVPYSFRHYFITQRVNSNLPPASVAEMCGTSITQIEKTYYHTSHAKMVSNALADYYIKDGMLIPK